jgi:hypothetical protein
MESASYEEGEVRRDSQVGRRGKAAGVDASGFASPAEARLQGITGRRKGTVKGLSVSKGAKGPEQFREPAPADSRAGWSRADPAGQSVDRSSENRPASLPRGNARPPGGSEADVDIGEALETAEAVASSRGTG